MSRSAAEKCSVVPTKSLWTPDRSPEGEGEEQPLPLQVAVSFRVNEKPKPIVALRSATETPKLDDPEFDRLTVPWENDPHQGHYLRESLNFTWDAEKKLVTVILDVGIRQLVWE